MTPEQLDEIVRELEEFHTAKVRVDHYGGVRDLDVFLQVKKELLEMLVENRELVKVIIEQGEDGYHLYAFSIDLIP